MIVRKLLDNMKGEVHMDTEMMSCEEMKEEIIRIIQEIENVEFLELSKSAKEWANKLIGDKNKLKRGEGAWSGPARWLILGNETC